MKALLYFVFIVAAVSGQTLNSADTSGKGKVGGFVGVNALVIRDFTPAAYSWAVVTYGVSNRTDIYIGASSTTLLGQTQNAAMLGWNANLLKYKGVSVSNFTLATTPLHKRVQASEATLFTSVVVSKSFKRLTPYTGYSATLPLGDTKGKLFTGPSVVHNVPVGIMIPKGKISYFAEYNFGGTIKTVGFGLAFTP